MATSKSQFNFRRYGVILLLISAIFALYLSREAATCIKDGLSGLDLGELSELERKDKNFDPNKRPNHSYQRSAAEGTGFMGRIVDTFPICLEESSFSEPRWAKRTFAGLLVAGVLLILLSLVIKPKWKTGVREQAKKRLKDQPEIGAGPSKKLPPPEPIDVGFPSDDDDD